MLSLPPPPVAYLHAEKFSHAIAPNRSARYSTVNSGDVLKVFMDKGLSLRTVIQQKVRKTHAHKDGLQRHVFRFNTGLTVADGQLDVLLRNSYDGTTAFGLSLGVFRIVCSNGLIAGTTFLRVNVPHSGKDVWSRVADGISRVMTEAPRMQDTVGRWSVKVMPSDMIERFAERVGKAMLPDGATILNPAKLLTVRRGEDTGADLWTVFNRVQENAMGGGLQYQLPTDAPGKVRHTRRIRGAESVFRTNVGLWDLANETEAELANV
jgi:hypothetical protein